jgi:hypothetical protein
MTDLVKRIDNAIKFKQLCEKHGITAVELNKRISKYAASLHPSSARNVVISRANLRKELDGGQMSDKLFAKALKIIGLSEEEIKEHVELEV